MINWQNFIFVSSEVESIKLNTDILETNLINIILLICLLVYVLGSVLKESLSLRQEDIITSLQESEKRLNEAKQRFLQVEAQTKQAQIVMKEIQNQIQETKINVIKAEFSLARIDLDEKFSSALVLINLTEQQALQNLVKTLTQLAINEISILLKRELTQEEHSFLIDTRSNCLGKRK